MKQVVRNPEVRQTHILASSKSDSHDIPIQQQIRNLQEEVGLLVHFSFVSHCCIHECCR